MDVSDLFPRKWVCAEDLKGEPRTVTIERLTIETVGKFRKPAPVLWFVGKSKGLILNKTKVDALAKLYGRETDGWHGKPIVLFPTVSKDPEGHSVSAVGIRPAVEAKA